jgi:hypothetical protein
LVVVFLEGSGAYLHTVNRSIAGAVAYSTGSYNGIVVETAAHTAYPLQERHPDLRASNGDIAGIYVLIKRV